MLRYIFIPASSLVTACSQEWTLPANQVMWWSYNMRRIKTRKPLYLNQEKTRERKKAYSKKKGSFLLDVPWHAAGWHTACDVIVWIYIKVHLRKKREKGLLHSLLLTHFFHCAVKTSTHKNGGMAVEWMTHSFAGYGYHTAREKEIESKQENEMQ